MNDALWGLIWNIIFRFDYFVERIGLYAIIRVIYDEMCAFETRLTFANVIIGMWGLFHP